MGCEGMEGCCRCMRHHPVLQVRVRAVDDHQVGEIVLRFCRVEEGGSGHEQEGTQWTDKPLMDRTSFGVEE